MNNLPNILTLSRIIAIPFIVGLMLCGQTWAIWTALGLYAAAAITDFFDGYLAREMNHVSAIGKFLDPIADKLLVGAVLLVLASAERLEGIWIIPAIVILVREIFIAGLREFLGPMDIQLPVSKLAKWKTTVQLVALGFLIVGSLNPFDIPSLEIGHGLLVIAALLAVITGWDYSKVGLQKIIEFDQKN